MRRNPLLTAVLAGALLLAGCGSKDTASGPPPALPPAEPTALIGTVLAEPVPVAATDGRTHLAYELRLTNATGGNVTLTSLTARDGDRQLLTLSGDNLKYWTRALGAPGTPTTVLGPGQSATVWLDIAVDGAAVPEQLTHAVELSVAKPVPGLIAASATQQVAPTSVSSRTPISLAPPLDGAGWMDINGCCGMTSHRMALNPINGSLWAAERFAVDYLQLDGNTRIATGDPAALTSYPYYGVPVHAVADATVRAVRDDLPDQTPGKAPGGLSLDQYPGNYVVLDLGDGNHALYAHLKPGSVAVKPGDRVTRGQSLAELGNSGNSTAPHLHFQVMDGPDPLAANGLPFVIDSFRLSQRVAGDPDLDRLFAAQPAKLTPGFAKRDLTEVGPLVWDVMDYSVSQ